VLGPSLAWLAWAFWVVVGHVGPGAGLVQLEQGDCMEKPPRWLPGVVFGPVTAEGAVRRLWPEAENCKSGIVDIQGLVPRVVSLAC
jgi:hypothetical protein